MAKKRINPDDEDVLVTEYEGDEMIESEMPSEYSRTGTKGGTAKKTGSTDRNRKPRRNQTYTSGTTDWGDELDDM